MKKISIIQLKTMIMLLFCLNIFGYTQSVDAQSFPCTFVLHPAQETICMHIDVNWQHFSKVSVDTSRPGGSIDFYFWREGDSEFLDQADLAAFNYQVFTRIDMSYMLSHKSAGTAPMCVLAAETKGQWYINQQGKPFYRIRASVQAGIYYLQVMLKSLNSSDYLSMERVEREDASYKRMLDFLEDYDQNNEFDLRFVPWSGTYYFGVTPAENEGSSVKLILKN